MLEASGGRRARRAGRARGPRGGVAVDVLRLVAVAYLAAVGSLLFWAHAPALLGWTPRVVLSGSMLPAIRPGDVAVVAPATPGPATLPVGHVVLVTDPSRSSGFYLHRLVRYQADGTLVTRGDANGVDDWPAVQPSKVSGQLRLVVPVVGLPLIWWRERAWTPLAASAGVTWAALALAFGLVRAPGPAVGHPGGRGVRTGLPGRERGTSTSTPA